MVINDNGLIRLQPKHNTGEAVENLFTYVRNDPVNNVDPSGLSTADNNSPPNRSYRQQQVEWINNAITDLRARQSYDASQGGANAGYFSQQVTLLQLQYDRLDLEERKNYARSRGDAATEAWLYDRLVGTKSQLADAIKASGNISAWDYTKAYGGGAIYGLGEGVANVGIGVYHTGKELTFQVADTANAVADLTGDRFYHGNLSGLGVASMMDDFSIKTHVAETGANVVSFGTYGEGKILYLYATGQIDANTASQQLGAAGVMQLASAALIHSGMRAAGTPGPGKEFSHFIPDRMGGPRSIWNGNYVPPEAHALSDPLRYQFMPRAWKEVNPMPPRPVQLWNRIPQAVKGVGAAAGVESQSPRGE